MHRINHVLLSCCLFACALRAQSNLEVIAAYYGVDRNFVDVTASARSQAQSAGLGLVVGADSLGGDPFPGQIKTFRLYYKLGGVFQQGEWKDGESVTVGRPGTSRRDSGMRGGGGLDRPSRTPAPIMAVPSGLKVISAQYGAGARLSDVTALLSGRIAGDRLTVLVENNNLGGDPIRGADKVLNVAYEWNGQRYTASAKEGQTLRLPPDQVLAVTPALPTNGVCLYPAANYQGTPTCAALGQDPAQVSGIFGSLKLLGTVRQVELFESANFAGRSLRLTADLPDLSRATSGFFGSPVTWAPNPGAFRMSQ